MTRVSERQTIIIIKINRHNQLVAFVSILLHEHFNIVGFFFFFGIMQHQKASLPDVNVE
jgi:hypothetical protein